MLYDAVCRCRLRQCAQSSDEPEIDKNAPVSSSNDGITIKQLPYTVKTSIIGGDKEMMLSVTNNTEFSLTDFQLHYTVKPDITDEQITEAFSGAEVKIKKLRKNGLTCEVSGSSKKERRQQVNANMKVKPHR